MLNRGMEIFWLTVPLMHCLRRYKMDRDNFALDDLAREVAESLQTRRSSRNLSSSDRISVRAVASSVVRQLSRERRRSLRAEFRSDRPLSVEVVASVVAHRLRMGSRIRGISVDALVSAVARRLAVRQ